jgi:catechol 2,3-dioxygenase-like lactoylglutathione lyase family enzyme
MGVVGINHIAFRTPDPAGLRAFYIDLFNAEPLDGFHAPLRAGPMLLALFHSDANYQSSDPDELAFDADLTGSSEILERARRLGVLTREPVEHTPWSKGVLVRDPDGRRLEVMYDDHGVFWQE